LLDEKCNKKCLYSTSDEAYKEIIKNFRKEIIFWVVMTILWIIIIFCGFYYREDAFLLLILSLILLLKIYLQADEIRKLCSQRIEIYEDKIKPPRRPLKNIIKGREYFIRIDDIADVITDMWGYQITIITKNGEKCYIRASDFDDPHGYKKLVQVLQKKIPSLENINLDSVIAFTSAKTDEDILKAVNLLKETNKEFAGPTGKKIQKVLSKKEGELKKMKD